MIRGMITKSNKFLLKYLKFNLIPIIEPIGIKGYTFSVEYLIYVCDLEKCETKVIKMILQSFDWAEKSILMFLFNQSACQVRLWSILQMMILNVLFPVGDIEILNQENILVFFKIFISHWSMTKNAKKHTRTRQGFNIFLFISNQIKCTWENRSRL